MKMAAAPTNGGHGGHWPEERIFRSAIHKLEIMQRR